MADRFTLTADGQTVPSSSQTSGIAVLDVPVNESFTLTWKRTDIVELTVDTPVTVPLPGPTPQAAVLMLKAVGGKVKATITNADGAAQVISFDSVLILINQSAMITALTLTRLPAVDTFVHVFMGQ